MKTLSLFIVSLLFTSLVYGTPSDLNDTTKSNKVKFRLLYQKPSKNILEFGNTSINFLDGRGINKNSKWDNSRINLINFTYTRYIHDKIFFQLERYSFRNQYRVNLESDPPGSLMSRFFTSWSLAGGYSFQKRVSNNAVFSLNPTFRVAYRYGHGDLLFLASYPPCLRVESSPYKSIGYGPGCSGRITLWDRATLAVQATYERYDEKYRDYDGRGIPPGDRFHQVYKPNREMLTYQCKLGVAF